MAEAKSLGIAKEHLPPVMPNFAQKMWADYSPVGFLLLYFAENQIAYTGNDPRELFFELEKNDQINIDKFLEFCWLNREREISGPSYMKVDWDGLLYHGIGSPLSEIIYQCFFISGTDVKDLSQSKSIGATLVAGDLVFNLNYDPVFELALKQLNRPYAYCPNKPSDDDILVCKPHGSLNLVANDTHFCFGEPEWLGQPQPPEYRSYSGIIPPRFNKSYSQSDIGTAILEPVIERKPDSMVMWGVGLTKSDADLNDLYSRWAATARQIDIINPDSSVADEAERRWGHKVRHFDALEKWGG